MNASNGPTFLGIPAELRLLVYQHLLRQPIDMRIKVKKMPVALLRVCRQILKEAAPVLYGNEFWVYPEPNFPHYMNSFFHNIGLKNFCYLRTLVFISSSCGCSVQDANPADVHVLIPASCFSSPTLEMRLYPASCAKTKRCVPHITNQIIELLRSNEFVIKYLRSKLLREVCITWNSTSCELLFKTVQYHLDWRQTFDFVTVESKNQLQLKDWRESSVNNSHTYFNHLPRDLLSQIVQHIVGPPQEIIIPGPYLLPIGIRANQRLYASTVKLFVAQNAFVLRWGLLESEGIHIPQASYPTLILRSTPSNIKIILETEDDISLDDIHIPTSALWILFSVGIFPTISVIVPNAICTFRAQDVIAAGRLECSLRLCSHNFVEAHYDAIINGHGKVRYLCRSTPSTELSEEENQELRNVVNLPGTQNTKCTTCKP
jgi:hypothetical protein